MIVGISTKKGSTEDCFFHAVEPFCCHESVCCMSKTSDNICVIAIHNNIHKNQSKRLGYMPN